MYQATAVETNNEDGQLTVEVQYQPKVDDRFISALTVLGEQMDNAVLRIYQRPMCRCGSDASHEARQNDGKMIHLCTTCVATTYDWDFARMLP